jgi:hypothetical protein
MYNTLLLPGNGTNLAQNNTFLDGSTNNFTITRNSNTTQGTFSPYGPNWSNYFDGVGDYLSLASTPPVYLSGSPFTIEAWVYPTATNTIIISRRSAVQARGFFLGYGNVTANKFSFYAGDSSILDWELKLDSTNTFSLNQWYHVAVTRNVSNVFTLWVNGASQATSTVSFVIDDDTSTLYIGAIDGGNGSFTGYISNLRLVSGTAVYTSAFTPSTTPLTAVSGTGLLTCQSNRLIDTSTTASAITKNGDVTVQRFSPFSPGATYSTSTIGGSGYFDGGGDYLYTPSSSNFALGTGDFTIECWIYVTAAFGTSGSGRGVLMSNRTVTSSSTSFVLQHYNGKIYFGTPNTDIFPTGSNTTMTINTWYHVAVTRNSGTARLFLNGVSDATPVTGDTTNFSDTSAVYIGCDGTFGLPQYSYTGYISDSRIVKGTAVYTANFTPPTAPVTAITNTSLLLNYTNAGIIDNAMMNILETVGDAKISTTQSKFGGSSIAFDGTTDYVIQPTNINFGYGTGDFTIEFWLYLNTISVDQTIVSNLTSTSSINPHIYFGFSSGINYYTNNANRITGSALSASTWYHIAVCRASGSTKMFINGTQTGSTYTDSNNYGTTAPLGIGTYWSAGSPVTTSTLNGYIDDLRITKGYARYTSNFTAPTAAFPTY